MKSKKRICSPSSIVSFSFTPAVLILVAMSFCSTTVAENFVPFVIPAKPNPNSPIAAPSAKPIGTDSPRLIVRDSHFYRSGRRVRLWGVNLSFGANMPSHADAPYVAARLAAAGVNTVRCHHMDSARWPRGLWNAKDGKTIAPEALDRLDYFIDQLARRGIFVNINLHVGRAHSRFLGLPEANRKYDKISNIFTPALIEAQKKFARDLLTHVNKYRKVRYADDPAVAFVEITNENSFFMWAGEETLRTLPDYYADILQAKFNAWLKENYGSDEKLRRAWAKGIEPLGKNLLSGSTTPLKDWHLEQHSGCKAAISPQRYQSKGALRIEIEKADQTEWHLQFNQGGLVVKAGRYYTVFFEAAADKPRKLGCGVSQAHDPWSNLGLSRQAQLKPDWQKFKFGFVAKADEDNARLSFAFGGSNVPFSISNVEFRPGGKVGLDKAESIKAGSVELFADNESTQRTLDRMRFLAETEKDYFDGMRNFVKKDLNCKALVTGTIVFGPLGLYTQSDMDFIDAHAYWQHPRFPRRSWDPGDWLIDQKPMTDYIRQAPLFRLAAQRLDGKPYTVSEYNHPAPLDSQAECVPMIASFAAAQDWDGVWLYTYSHSSDDWDREHLNSYFDIDTNPAKWGFMRAGTAIFRDVRAAAPGEPILVALTGVSDALGSLAKLHLAHDRDMFALIADHANLTRDKLLKRPIAVDVGKGPPLMDGSGPKQELTWSVENGKGFYAARGNNALVYTGHAERFEGATDGKISIAGPDFVALTITTLDNKPLAQSQKMLIVACGRCENTGMKFSEDRRTVGRDWGGPPVQIEPVEGTLELIGRWTCQALGPDGMPKQDIVVFQEGGQTLLRLSPTYETMWYLLRQQPRQ